MLLMLVAAVLGVIGFGAVAGATTLVALSHAVPGELWQIASVSIGALSALLAGHAVSTSSDSPLSLRRRKEPEASTVVNNAAGSVVEPGPAVVDTSHLGPEAVEALHGYLSGSATAQVPEYASLPAPPSDTSTGRDAPPGGARKLPARPRVQSRASTRKAAKRAPVRRGAPSRRR